MSRSEQNLTSKVNPAKLTTSCATAPDTSVAVFESPYAKVINSVPLISLTGYKSSVPFNISAHISQEEEATQTSEEPVSVKVTSDWHKLTICRLKRTRNKI